MPASEPLRFRTAVALALVHVILFWAAFAPLDLWPLIFVAPVPLLWLAMRAASYRQAAFALAIVTVPGWLVADLWVMPISVAGWPAKAVALTPLSMLLVVCVRLVARSRWGCWPAAWWLPVVWIAMEVVRGEAFLHGYPWYLAGHPLIAWPLLAQVADVLGAYGAGLLPLVVAGTIVDLMRGHRRGASLATSVIVAAVVTGYGAWRMAAETLPGPTILAVQTNLEQSNKIGWTLERQLADFEDFVRSTIDAVDAARAEGHAVDLVLWPETMLPGFGLEPESVAFLADNPYQPRDFFARSILRLSERVGAPLVVGSPSFVDLQVVDQQWQWSEHYNSAYQIEDGAVVARVDKVQLTPFGETMPYISAWPWLEERLLAIGATGMAFNLDAGAPARLTIPFAEGPVDAAVPICFEATMPRVCRRLIGDASRPLLINLTNDGWFTDHDAVRASHAQAARFRAIELRAPLVRCANTGYSISVDSRGKVVSTIGNGRYGESRRAGALLAPTRLDPRHAPYRLVAPWVTWMWPVGLGLMLVFRGRGGASPTLPD